MIKFELIKKEIKEYLKTPKGLILLVLFLFFAFSSPLLAKYINEILASVATDVEIIFPEPTLKDSWMQYFKNMNSICIIVYLIVMTGTISQEKNKGSIILVLTKKVSRFSLIFSKFLVGSLVFTVLFLLSTLVNGWYTNILFDEFNYNGLIISLLLQWLMGIFFTALAIFTSVIGKTPTTSALLGFFAFAILQIFNISSELALYNPSGASAIVNSILANTVDNSKLWIPIISSILFTVFLLAGSQIIFKRQEL